MDRAPVKERSSAPLAAPLSAPVDLSTGSAQIRMCMKRPRQFPGAAVGNRSNRGLLQFAEDTLDVGGLLIGGRSVVLPNDLAVFDEETTALGE
jgi:hypothetical protein